MKTCETCVFYFPKNTQCRRFPPKAIVGPSRLQGGGLGVGSTWPPVTKDQWCGEHKASEEKP